MTYGIGRNIALLVWRINRAELSLNLELVHQYIKKISKKFEQIAINQAII